MDIINELPKGPEMPADKLLEYVARTSRRPEVFTIEEMEYVANEYAKRKQREMRDKALDWAARNAICVDGKIDKNSIYEGKRSPHLDV